MKENRAFRIIFISKKSIQNRGIKAFCPLGNWEIFWPGTIKTFHAIY